MEKMSVSFRTDARKVKQLDLLAKRQRRDRTQLIDEAIENFLEVQRWQIQEIKLAMQEADAGNFASDEEVRAVFDRLQR